MSRTDKDEHATDGWHITHRLERQARQPQRNQVAFHQDLLLDSDSLVRTIRYRTHPVRSDWRLK